MDQDDDAVAIRRATPEDHDTVVSVVDAWWGRPVAHALPRLFLDHFHNTSLIAEDRAGLAGLLVAFFSPAQHSEAYIHFVAVRPDLRHRGLGRRLYEMFFEDASANGRTLASAITASINADSVGFHRSLGFDVRGPIDDYDRPGTAHFVFKRPIHDDR